MDKIASKAVFAAAGLPQARYLAFNRREWERNPAEVIARIEAALTLPGVRETGQPGFQHRHLQSHAMRANWPPR